MTADGTGSPSSAGSGFEDVAVGLDSDDADQGTRLIAADCGGVRVHSCTSPTAAAWTATSTPAKLAWLARLRQLLAEPAPRTSRWPCAATSTWPPRTVTSGTRPSSSGRPT